MLPPGDKTQIDPFANFHQSVQPSACNRAGVAVAGDVEVAVVHAVYHHIIAAAEIGGSGGENIRNSGGAAFQRGDLRRTLFFGKPALPGLLFQFFLLGLLCGLGCFWRLGRLYPMRLA